MKKLGILITLLLFTVTNAYSSRCSKCGGTGRMVVISDKTSNFGINRTKRQCPICGGWFLGEHTEPCDACGGTGHVTTASDRVREQQSSRNNNYAADGYSKLTADELARIEMLKELLKGRTESIPCDLCKQTGRCFMCGGSGYRGSNACSSCAGLGVCTVCGGQKIQGIRTVPPTQEEREDIQRQIAEIVANAVNRGSGNKSKMLSTNYSDDESVEITESSESDSESEGFFSKHPTLRGMLIFLVVMIAIMIYQKFIKR